MKWKSLKDYEEREMKKYKKTGSVAKSFWKFNDAMQFVVGAKPTKFANH